MEIGALFSSVATLVFVAGSAAVAGRLLALARRTRELPELLLGGAILGTAVLGYGVLIAAFAVRGGIAVAPADVPLLAVALAGVGRTLHDVGVTLFLLFVVVVFHRREAWAWALASVLVALLWAGFFAGVAQGSLRVDRVGSAPWLCEYVVIWSYPLWNVVESLRYWRLLRRREALGLADPVVTNRFLLWGTGSSFTALAIWTSSIPFVFVSDPARLLEITPAVRVATAATGLVSVTCSLFAFLPPAWYRRIVAARAAAVPGR